MAKLSHVLALVSYAVAAAGLAVGLLHLGLAGVQPVSAAALSLAAFAVCALIHLSVARARRQAELAADLRHLRRGHAELRDELGNARRELSALLEALEAAGGNKAVRDESSAVDRISGEVRVLKHLVERLFEDSEGVKPEAAFVQGTRRTETPAEATGETVETEVTTAAPQPAQSPKAAPNDTDESKRTVLPEVKHGIDDAAILDTVREGLRHDRVEVVLQPVVGLPQRKRRYHECFTRVRSDDGYMILPEQYIEVAEQAGLVAAIDNLLLFRCIQLVRKMQRRHRDVHGFFCNVALDSLRDHDFVRELTSFLEQNRDLARGVIFEVTQAAAREAGPEELRCLARLGRLGCRFAIDNVSDLELDPAGLQRSRICFVKVDSKVLLETAQRQGGDAVRKLKRGLDAHKIDLIADRVEDEDTLVELLDLGIDFGQGYLFGEPRLARP